MLGVAHCLFTWIQYGGFGAAGQSLTRKLREASFKALLSQEVAYFDHEEHSSGALCARLAMDVTLVQDQVRQRASLSRERRRTSRGFGGRSGTTLVLYPPISTSRYLSSEINAQIAAQLPASNSHVARIGPN
jgi:hypothetical protein